MKRPRCIDVTKMTEEEVARIMIERHGRAAYGEASTRMARASMKSTQDFYRTVMIRVCELLREADAGPTRPL